MDENTRTVARHTVATLLNLHNKGMLTADDTASQIYTWVHRIPELWDMIPDGSSVHNGLVSLENDAIRQGIDLLLIDTIALVKHVNDELISRLEITSFGCVALVVNGQDGTCRHYHINNRLSDFSMLRSLTETITKEEVGGFADQNSTGDKIEITLFVSQGGDMKSLSYWKYGSTSAKPTGHIAKAIAYFDAMQANLTKEATC